MIAHNAESARGTTPQAAHRSGLEPRDSSGSCHPMKTAVFHLERIGSSCCPGISRFLREVSAHVIGDFERAGLRWTSPHRCAAWGLPPSPTASASRSGWLARLNTRPHVPLSTPRRRPRKRLRMSQGRCGVATSHSYGFFIHYTSPVLNRCITKER